MRIALAVALFLAGASKAASFRFRSDYDEYQAQMDKLSVQGYMKNEQVKALEIELETAQNESKANITDTLTREKEGLRQLRWEIQRLGADKADEDLIEANVQRSSLVIGSLALTSCILLTVLEIGHTTDPQCKARFICHARASGRCACMAVETESEDGGQL